MALTPRQHDAIAAYVVSGDRATAARAIGVTLNTMRNHINAFIARSDSLTTLEALNRREWIVVPERPRRSVLTPRELAVLRAGAEGLSNKQAAHQLDTTVSGVHAAMRRVRRKLGATSAIDAYSRLGWLTPARPVAIPARGASGFAERSGTEPGGRDYRDVTDEGPQ